MRFVARRFVSRFALFILLFIGARAHAQIPEGWEIVEIANDPAFYHAWADINDRGQVVFHRTIAPSLDRNAMEIFLYDRGQLVRLTDDDTYDAFPRINNHGDIVWVREIQGPGTEGAIVLWRNGELTTISDQLFWEFDPAIQNDKPVKVWVSLPFTFQLK